MIFYQLIIDSRTLLNIWKQRWLSLAGKIQTFKSLIASRPIYIAAMKNKTPFVIEELQALHKDFIWGGRRPKIKHSTLIGSYEKGGFKDIDLTSKFKSLKGIWIQKLLDETNSHPLQEVAKVILGDLRGEKIFHTNLFLEQSNKEICNKLPKFYKELLDLWQSLSKGEINELEFVLTQNLWNNAFILSGNNPLFNRSLVSKGINYISDLIDCDGNFTCWNSIVSKFNLNINDFFAWFGVIHCIPSNWKCIIRSYFPLQTVQYDKVKYFHRGIFCQ